MWPNNTCSYQPHILGWIWVGLFDMLRTRTMITKKGKTQWLEETQTWRFRIRSSKAVFFKPYCWWKNSCTTWDLQIPVIVAYSPLIPTFNNWFATCRIKNGPPKKNCCEFFAPENCGLFISYQTLRWIPASNRTGPTCLSESGGCRSNCKEMSPSILYQNHTGHWSSLTQFIIRVKLLNQVPLHDIVRPPYSLRCFCPQRGQQSYPAQPLWQGVQGRYFML